MSKELDLLVLNGHVLDSYSGMDGMYAIGIKDGKIKGVYPKDAILPKSTEVLDVHGKYVSAGWIDLHTHVANERAAIGIDPDIAGVKSGVTTVVDAGSAGSATFSDFEEKIVKHAKTRILSWINISSPGLYEGHNELVDLSRINEAETINLIQTKPFIRGIKVRMSRSVVKDTDTKGLQIAKKVSRQLDVPVFVHIGNKPPKLTDVLNLLDKGDVVTHIFHGKPGGCLDTQEDILPELQEALNRGIYLDLGHGTESCSFFRIKQARERGLSVDTISTDIYSKNYTGPVFSLSCTMEKCMALGMSLREVLAAVTIKPSEILRMPEIGRVRVGADADLTIFSIKDAEKEYVDSEGNKLQGHQQFVIHGVVRGGRII